MKFLVDRVEAHERASRPIVALQRSSGMENDTPLPTEAKAQTERAVKAQTKLADSAGHLKDSAQLQLESAERRTVLAADRTVYAAERTYAAWMRTGLAALASGIGARSLLVDAAPLWLIRSTGSVLVVFSAFCFIAAVWRQVTPEIAKPMPQARELPAWALGIFTLLMLLVCLAALVGIWWDR